MHVLKLYYSDLSTTTLEAIRDDLAKYAHLKQYAQTFAEIVEVITTRKGDEKRKHKEKNI